VYTSDSDSATNNRKGESDDETTRHREESGRKEP